MIQKYDKMMYASGPVTFTDYVNNNYDKIHAELYNNALQKYLYAHPEYMLYRSAYNFIETKQPEYWQPSYVSIISKHYPYTKHKVWLDEYWCKYKKETPNYTYTYIDEDTIKDAQIVELNYVTGEANMKSRFTGVEFKIPFNKIDETTPISDEFGMEHSFITKIQGVR